MVKHAIVPILVRERPDVFLLDCFQPTCSRQQTLGYAVQWAAHKADEAIARRDLTAAYASIEAAYAAMEALFSYRPAAGSWRAERD